MQEAFREMVASQEIQEMGASQVASLVVVHLAAHLLALCQLVGLPLLAASVEEHQLVVGLWLEFVAEQAVANLVVEYLVNLVVVCLLAYQVEEYPVLLNQQSLRIH